MRPTIAFALAGLAACAHPTEPAVPAAPIDRVVDARTHQERVEAADAQVATDLEQLRDLQLFEVGELIGGDGSQAFQCYGVCPNVEELVADYEARADRLAALVTAAEEARPTAGCGMDAVDESLEALRGLQVVDVGAFIHQEAAASPSCYNLPCPADVEAAEASNCERATTLASLAGTLAAR